ncbi:hypothetical protein KY331_01515 [Candidatus Woesearchaeota archaeon]|nr:hypothetical protein [Candidatus Woesearchaeota archaeon]
MGIVLKKSDVRDLEKTVAESRGYVLLSEGRPNEYYSVGVYETGKGETFFDGFGNENDENMRDAVLFSAPQLKAMPYHHQKGMGISSENFLSADRAHDISNGFFEYFCVVNQDGIVVFKPVKKETGVKTEIVDYEVVDDKDIDPVILNQLSTQKEYVAKRFSSQRGNGKAK